MCLITELSEQVQPLLCRIKEKSFKKSKKSLQTKFRISQLFATSNEQKKIKTCSDFVGINGYNLLRNLPVYTLVK